MNQLPNKSTRSPKPSAGQLQESAPDAGNTPLNDSNPFGLSVNNQRCLLKKTERSLYFNFQVSSEQLDCLSFVDTFLKVNKRETAPATIIVGFTGRSRKWKAAMYRTINRNIRAGLLMKVKSYGGHAIGLTDKSRALFQAEDEKYNEIKAGLSDPSKHSIRWSGNPAKAKRERAKLAA